MTNWINFTGNIKDWFESKEQFEFVKMSCNIMNAIEVRANNYPTEFNAQECRAKEGV